VRVVRTIAEARAALAARRDEGSVGLVPTMGALHAGHVALLRAARDENEVVVASVFVNRSQFDSDQDLARYPRDEEHDLRVAA
jgi:pantoate--beta-alanine ligase